MYYCHTLCFLYNLKYFMLVSSFILNIMFVKYFVVKYIKDVSEVPTEIKGMKILTMSG